MSMPISMDRIVKTEIQPDGQMLLYYVDENGTTEQGILTTMDEGDAQTQAYTLVEEMDSSMIRYEVSQEEEEQETEAIPEDGVQWTEEETKRCIIFYTDNKETFINGQVNRNHLWNAACKTMIPGKTPETCEDYLQILKQKYAESHLKKLINNEDCDWQFYELCNQAFNDDPEIQQLLSSYFTNGDDVDHTDANDISILPDNDVPSTNAKTQNVADPNVARMLQLYFQYKNAVPKTIWKKIAIELGDTAEYWHKRFLNYKSTYVKILDTRKEGGLTQKGTSWPYFQIFDKIYQDDKTFQRKYVIQKQVQQQQVQIKNDLNEVNAQPSLIEWDNTEITVLVKYFFDSFDEFQDPTIPNSYLWSEIGRLLDRSPQSCEEKYNELKNIHLNQHVVGGYNLSSRKPVQILFDSIIYKEIKKAISLERYRAVNNNLWETEEIDSLVQFIYDNLEMFKDDICHYVCWAAISKHLLKSLKACLVQIKDLTALYKSILDDKKENPDMQIDWRYTDMFDRIFDYGMDTQLFKKIEDLPVAQETGKHKQNKTNGETNDLELSEEEDETSSPANEPREKQVRGVGDPKHYKILEYYIKHKEKFGTGPRYKKAQWAELANEIGLSKEQCLHRFRNLKQVYLAQIEKEMNTPDKPILWPYYNICKKAFGYRDIKNKVRSKTEPYVSGEWTPKEIKQLINYFGKQYDPETKSENIDWSEVAQELKRSDTACKDKFFDLRKSYRQIKTMVNRGGNCKVTWKYYKLIDAVYNKQTDTVNTVAPNSVEVLVEAIRADCNSVEENSIEDNNLATEENNSAKEENNSAIEENNSAIEENNSTIEENNSAIEENNSTIEENNSAIEENNYAIEENNSTIEENNSAAADNTSIIEESNSVDEPMIEGDSIEENQNNSILEEITIGNASIVQSNTVEVSVNGMKPEDNVESMDFEMEIDGIIHSSVSEAPNDDNGQESHILGQ